MEMSAPSTLDSAQLHSRYGSGAPGGDPTNAQLLDAAGLAGSLSDSPCQGKLDLAVKDFARVLGCEVALVCELDALRQPQVVSSWGVDDAVPITVPKRGGRRRERVNPAHGGCFVGRALTHRRPAFETLKSDRDATLINATDRPLTHGLAAPVSTFGEEGDRVLVALFAGSPGELARPLWVADSYARLVALIGHDVDALGGLMAPARLDGLTGCLTYESLLLELVREMNRAARAKVPLSCCFIDLDGFKRVNDGHGHVRGNEILADVGLALKEGVRSCDTVGRYGGDEFIAILPHTSEDEAATLARRIRYLIASRYSDLFDEPLTASIGVAEWTDGTSTSQLLARADSALFTAKSQSGGVASFGHRSSQPVGRDPVHAR
jgi:diguanylate cyclase (GGDEF)-like protein